MNKRSGKKKTFYASVVSMMLCLSMLIGTTLAWFTDTAVNAGNRIVAGSLDVELHMHDGTFDETGKAVYVDISGQTGDIFSLNSDGVGNGNGLLWEPGKTEVVFLKVENAGDMALNYNIVLDVAVEAATPDATPADISSAMKYAVLADTDVVKFNEYKEALEAAKEGKEKWNVITAAAGADNVGSVPGGRTTAAPNGALEAGEEEYFALAIHMNEDAGNAYQGHTVKLNVAVAAKQMVSENDYFGNTYDENAKFDRIPTGNEPDYPYYPGVEGAKNLFENPGFEELDETTGFPKGWGYTKNKAQLEIEDVYTGNYAVFVSGSGNPYVTQDAYLEPSTTYQLSFWTKYDSKGTGAKGGAVKLEFFSDNGEKNHMPKYSGYIERYGYEDWFRYTYQFTTPAGCNYMQFFFRNMNATAGYGVWIDDVELIQIGDTEALDLRTDHIFYYPEWGQMKVTATAVDRADSNKYVKFYLKDGETELASSNAISLGGYVATKDKPEDGAASYSFDINFMTEYMKEYTVEAVLCDANGNAVPSDSNKQFVSTVVSTDVYRSSKPENLNDDGTFKIYDENGNVVEDSFVPAIAYHAYNDFDRMKDLGVNTIQANNMLTVETALKRLDTLQEAGVKALVQLYYYNNPAGSVSNAEAVKAVVAAVKDHPAVLGYMIMDEPGDTTCNEEAMKNSYKIIRTIDKKHPVYLCSNGQYEWCAQYCDIMSVDPYPGAKAKKDGVDNGDAVVTFTYNKVAGEVLPELAENYKNMPIYVITQAWPYGTLTPTYDDMKTQLYLSILAGAKGVGYFALDGKVDNVSVKDTEIFQAANDFEDVESKILYDYFVRGIAGKDVDDLLVAENLALGADGTMTVSDKNVNGRYVIWKEVDDQGVETGNLYVMVVDGDNETDTVSITLNGITNFTATLISKEGTNNSNVADSISTVDGTLSFNLDARESALIKIVPTN